MRSGQEQSSDEEEGLSADDLSDFFDNAAIPLHWVDGAGVVIRVNDAELKLLGYSRSEYLGRKIADFHVDGDVISDILRRLTNGETLREYPARLRAKDGSIRQVRITSNVKWKEGRFVHTRCITREVEETREHLRNRLAAIVESSDDAIISKSLDGIIESWNAGAERIFGYTAAEAIGRHITLIIPPGLGAEEENFIDRLRAGERIEHYETVRVAKDGARIDVSLTISPVRDLEGRIVGASKISRDITARKRDEEALREADRRKDEFLAVLAHELRNPLAPIRSSLDLLRMDDTGEHAIKARTIIERQVGHMVRLVDDLLEVSRISQGKIELRSEPVDVSAVILSAIETSRPAVEAGKHRLSMTLPTESLAVKGDFVRLGQVVANLLNNAARYTSSAGTISVSAERDDGHAVIAVRDSGVGIEPGMLPRIFEMFVQIERPGHRAKGGLGIGLSLARNLVKLHGGEISARSDGLGKGSTFEVRLPLISSAVPKTANEVPPDCEKARHSVKRVLVVDDNVDAAQSLGMMLVAMGHQVRVEHAGTAALEAARAEAPDVALLDIGMPEMDGLELARRLRREPGLQNVRLAAVTGFGGQEDVARSKAAGFDEHLVKPVSPDVLRLVVER